MSDIPSYILDRVRQRIPIDSFVISGSTPVVSFGNVQTARIATLGLNPSKREFTNVKGEWLDGSDRKLATLGSLNVGELATANRTTLGTVVNDCYQYFYRQPYMAWFGALETILNKATNASYFDGTACHLDLVQWATEPVWQKLPAEVRARLINDDRDFLVKQLEQEHIKMVLVNGRSVIRQLEAMGVIFDIRQQFLLCGKKCEFVIGEKYGTKFIGWSVNLQSSFGVSNEFKLALADKVQSLVV